MRALVAVGPGRKNGPKFQQYKHKMIQYYIYKGVLAKRTQFSANLKERSSSADLGSALEGETKVSQSNLALEVRKRISVGEPGSEECVSATAIRQFGFPTLDDRAASGRPP